ncbi:MAG: hypothetical protein RBU25_14065 [Lentisphaeria bacterium]|nr:hypothetical protein [Lentisphaeria bacterium]
MAGILDATKVLRVPARDSGEPRSMGFAAIEDATGLFSVFLAPEVHARLGQLFQGIGPYRLRGRVACQWGVPSLESIPAQPVPATSHPESDLAGLPNIGRKDARDFCIVRYMRQIVGVV